VWYPDPHRELWHGRLEGEREPRYRRKPRHRRRRLRLSSALALTPSSYRLDSMPPRSKNKLPPIDWTSTATALGSSNFNSSQWMEEGVRQEGQGQRYQYGDKATRHYSNAVIAYRVASQLDPTSFQAVFDDSRVAALLASDFLPLSMAICAFEEALATVRRAREMAPTVETRIEATFNLAQVLVSLREIKEELDGSGMSGEEGINLGLEAKACFAEVERMERMEMDKLVGAAGGATEAMDTRDAGEDDEVNIVTPDMVVDTLLESIANDLDLYSDPHYESSSSLPPRHSAELHASIISSCLGAIALSQETPDSTLLPLELSLTLLSVVATCGSAHLPPWLPSYACLYPSNTSNANFLSSWADALVETDPQSALAHYERAFALLSDRMKPPKDVPAYSIPPLLASNLLARSHAHLLLFQSSPSLHLIGTPLQLAMDAINACGVGYRVGESGVVKVPGEKRGDWKTVKVFKAALMELVSMRNTVQPTDAGVLGELWKEVTGTVFVLESNV
jgi:hypothetical protein